MNRTIFILVVFGTLFVLNTAAFSGQATPPRNVSITVVELCIVSMSPLELNDCNPVIGGAINGSVGDTYSTGRSYRGSLDDGVISKNIPVLKILFTPTTPNFI